MELDESREYRRRFQERHAALCIRCPIASSADWMNRFSSQPGLLWLVAYNYACLPTIGEEISACILIASDSECGKVHWEHRWGLLANPDVSLADQRRPEFASGEWTIDAQTTAQLARACARFWDGGAAALPCECYDGTPVEVTVVQFPTGEAKTGSCNIMDHGTHPTRQLAALAARVTGCHPGDSKSVPGGDAPLRGCS